MERKTQQQNNAHSLVKFFSGQGKTLEQAKSDAIRVLDSILSKTESYTKAYQRSHNSLALEGKRKGKFRPGEEQMFSIMLFSGSAERYQMLIQKIN